MQYFSKPKFIQKKKTQKPQDEQNTKIGNKENHNSALRHIGT